MSLDLKVLAANRVKKGYYIRHVKESLWATFGINQIKPFDENFTRDQMKSWKNQENVKKVYDDLYFAADSNDPDSDTFLTLIIKNVFVSEKEQTRKNAVWIQAILEIIFDEHYLSPKIDSDTVDGWYEKLIAMLGNKVINISFIILYLMLF